MKILDFLERFRMAYNSKDINFLEKVYSDDALIIVGTVLKEKQGSEDMLKGVDIKIIVDGKEHTAQVKPFSHITRTSDNMYKVDGTANVKRYQTDWMIFMKNLGDTVIFNNKNTKIFDGVYYFPIDDKLYQL